MIVSPPNFRGWNLYPPTLGVCNSGVREGDLWLWNTDEKSGFCSGGNSESGPSGSAGYANWGFAVEGEGSGQERGVVSAVVAMGFVVARGGTDEVLAVGSGTDASVPVGCGTDASVLVGCGTDAVVIVGCETVSSGCCSLLPGCGIVVTGEIIGVGVSEGEVVGDGSVVAALEVGGKL